MNFYIASRLENADTVTKVSNVLKAAGHVHTYDWTKHGSVKDEGQDRIEEVAENEMRGVKGADIVIAILPGGRGTHAELGIALGNGCNNIIICAENDDAFQQDDRTCAFYWNKPITRVVGGMDVWLTEALSQARKVDHLHRCIEADV